MITGFQSQETSAKEEDRDKDGIVFLSVPFRTNSSQLSEWLNEAFRVLFKEQMISSI